MIAIRTPPLRELLVAECNELEEELQKLKAGQHDPSIDPVKHEVDIREARDSIKRELGELKFEQP